MSGQVGFAWDRWRIFRPYTTQEKITFQLLRKTYQYRFDSSTQPLPRALEQDVKGLPAITNSEVMMLFDVLERSFTYNSSSQLGYYVGKLSEEISAYRKQRNSAMLQKVAQYHNDPETLFLIMLGTWAKGCLSQRVDEKLAEEVQQYIGFLRDVRDNGVFSNNEAGDIHRTMQAVLINALEYLGQASSIIQATISQRTLGHELDRLVDQCKDLVSDVFSYLFQCVCCNDLSQVRKIALTAFYDRIKDYNLMKYVDGNEHALLLQQIARIESTATLFDLEIEPLAPTPIMDMLLAEDPMREQDIDEVVTILFGPDSSFLAKDAPDLTTSFIYAHASLMRMLEVLVSIKAAARLANLTGQVLITANADMVAMLVYTLECLGQTVRDLDRDMEVIAQHLEMKRNEIYHNNNKKWQIWTSNYKRARVIRERIVRDKFSSTGILHIILKTQNILKNPAKSLEQAQEALESWFGTMKTVLKYSSWFTAAVPSVNASVRDLLGIDNAGLIDGQRMLWDPTEPLIDRGELAWYTVGQKGEMSIGTLLKRPTALPFTAALTMTTDLENLKEELGFTTYTFILDCSTLFYFDTKESTAGLCKGCIYVRDAFMVERTTVYNGVTLPCLAILPTEVNKTGLYDDGEDLTFYVIAFAHKVEMAAHLNLIASPMSFLVKLKLSVSEAVIQAQVKEKAGALYADAERYCNNMIVFYQMDAASFDWSVEWSDKICTIQANVPSAECEIWVTITTNSEGGILEEALCEAHGQDKCLNALAMALFVTKCPGTSLCPFGVDCKYIDPIHSEIYSHSHAQPLLLGEPPTNQSELDDSWTDTLVQSQVSVQEVVASQEKAAAKEKTDKERRLDYLAVRPLTQCPQMSRDANTIVHESPIQSHGQVFELTMDAPQATYLISLTNKGANLLHAFVLARPHSSSWRQGLYGNFYCKSKEILDIPFRVLEASHVQILVHDHKGPKSPDDFPQFKLVVTSRIPILQKIARCYPVDKVEQVMGFDLDKVVPWEIHPNRCKHCMVKPIIGTRWSCSRLRCWKYHLCSRCKCLLDRDPQHMHEHELTPHLTKHPYCEIYNLNKNIDQLSHQQTEQALLGNPAQKKRLKK